MKRTVLAIMLILALSFISPGVFAADFVPVVDIINVPTQAVVGTPLPLTGTVLPNNATNKNITWSIRNAGTTGAVISGNILTATASGTTTITATIEGGSFGQFASIAAGNSHTVGIKTDGSLWAWGLNNHGQLGNGTREPELSPVKIGDKWKSASVGWGHTVAIKTDNIVWSWGNNEYGQLGSGTKINKLTPNRVILSDR